MDRTQKEALVASLHQTLQDNSLVVVMHQTGMSVAEATDLRRKMHGNRPDPAVEIDRMLRRANLLRNRIEQREQQMDIVLEKRVRAKV